MSDTSGTRLDFGAAEPHIIRALEYAGGTHSLDDIREMLDDGRLQLWSAPHSAIITEILDYPRCRCLHFFLAGGRMEELEAMVPGILEWGQHVGCSRASMAGRPGWARSFLTRDGWSTQHTVLTKEL